MTDVRPPGSVSLADASVAAPEPLRVAAVGAPVLFVAQLPPDSGRKALEQDCDSRAEG